MAYMGAEARVTRSHGHGTSKKRGPRNSCRSRNYFLSFGLIVTQQNQKGLAFTPTRRLHESGWTALQLFRVTCQILEATRGDSPRADLWPRILVSVTPLFAFDQCATSYWALFFAYVDPTLQLVLLRRAFALSIAHSLS
ncbi:hypothetical protein Ahy_A09g042339 [Arachis hypogaea]|uniref:Uncharacterized protein n=1 Tax=Arachis hypogaea TaxID=3818 RepID=A0A445BFJ3_ARAHY|nr:hypothetical protein Ahy_A09g042339 [Arachis hypogaea]